MRENDASDGLNSNIDVINYSGMPALKQVDNFTYDGFSRDDFCNIINEMKQCVINYGNWKHVNYTAKKELRLRFMVQFLTCILFSHYCNFFQYCSRNLSFTQMLYKLECPQSRCSDQLLLIYSFLFRSAFC